jgi:phosphate transport system substrate-binding protein
MTSRSMLRQLAVLTLGAVAAAGASARTEIQNKGSDTLVNAAQSLAEQYGKVNPKVADSITVTDLAKIYGRDGGASKWSDLGITIPGCKGEIVVVSRQNNSGTYAYFKEAVLGEKGKFRQGTLDMHGSKDVADLVEKTPCAIGYSGLAYVTDHMKALCVAPAAGKPCIKPTEQTAFDGTYPIARPLFMYTNGEPTGEVKKYMDWIKSDVGQCIVEKEGYAPIKKVKCK